MSKTIKTVSELERKVKNIDYPYLKDFRSGQNEGILFWIPWLSTGLGTPI